MNDAIHASFTTGLTDEAPWLSTVRARSLPAEVLVSHQPYRAARPHFLTGLSRKPEACEAFARAMDPCADAAMAEYLAERMNIPG